MLEQACLLVHPWSRADDKSPWTRRVTDPAGVNLGFVRFDPPPPGWFAWLRSLKLSVFETADASHLMTVTRPWAFSGIWDVYDAEDSFVGMICMQTLFSSDRRFLGKARNEADGARAIHNPSDKLLASMRPSADRSTVISFTNEAMSNPFLRMMLLGAFLCRELPSG